MKIIDDGVKNDCNGGNNDDDDDDDGGGGDDDDNPQARWLAELKAAVAAAAPATAGGAPADGGLDGALDDHAMIELPGAEPSGAEEALSCFLHKSSLWQHGARRVLNCRRIAFAGTCHSPCDAVAVALRLSFVAHDEPESRQALVAFLDAAAAIKRCSLTSLSESERICFALNLYHLMISHAHLVLGPPRSSYHWATFATTVAYQCADDVFTSAELEHCLIRAGMSAPSAYISK